MRLWRLHRRVGREDKDKSGLAYIAGELHKPTKNSYFIETKMVTVMTSTSVRGDVAGLRAAPRKAISTRPRLITRASAIAGEVPDRNKRNIMNLLLLGAVGAPAVALAGPFAYFFVPKRYGF